MTSTLWDNIPEELKWNNQWLLAGPNEKGELKVPFAVRNGRLVHGSSTDGNWMDFDTCCDYAEQLGYGIGYVLTADDAYACIDLDVKNIHNEPDHPELWSTQEQLNRFWKICQAFESYTERSRGLHGLHIWVRGKIGAGCKHDGVEVYSQERFIACTGNIVLNNAIEHKQDLLNILVEEIRVMQGAGKGGSLALVELEEVEDDDVIIDRAINAGNADKFNLLCSMTAGPEGSWVGHYKSQSEADLALLSIFTFYSKSNEQCRRLFRMTKLAQREKSLKDDRYLNLTLQLVRSRQSKEAAVDEQTRAMAASLVAEMQAKRLADAEQAAQQAPQPAQGASVVTGTAAPQSTIDWPPGLAGAIAWHIYQSAPRPVKEVAIVSALGLLAGICGKAYQIPQSGLNLYIVLVARSAIGKEAMHSGIGGILAELRESCPPVQRFVDFADFASGPALQKAVAANTSFVNVAGEFGKKLERLSREEGRDAAMQSLRKSMTDLYQKSGKTSVVGGLTYSNKEQNVGSVSGVAYSMIGETTPGTFYNSLSEAMMEDGFLSRFTVIEHNGDRPPLNRNPVTRMDPGLANALHLLVVQAITILDRHIHTDVQFDPASFDILAGFDKLCDEEINSTTDESWRQMWNRAHLKVLRISALLAAADNHLMPMVYPVHVNWAMDVVKRDIKMFQTRIASGDIGQGDAVREAKLLSTMRDYLNDGVTGGYNIPESLVKGAIIPRKLLQIRCARVTAFSQHRNGASYAMDSALRSLVDSGYIVEVDKTKMVTEHNYHGKCYRIINLPTEVTTKRKNQ